MVQIHQIVFADGYVTISYQEATDVSDDGRTAVVKELFAEGDDRHKDLVDGIKELAAELVDEYLLELQSPETQITRGPAR